MAVPYTRRFVAAVVDAPGVSQIWTATDLYVWIIRDIILEFHGSGANTDIALSINAGGKTYPLLRNQSATPGELLHWEGRQEILPSEVLQLFSSAGFATAVVTGYALTPTGF